MLTIVLQHAAISAVYKMHPLSAVHSTRIIIIMVPAEENRVLKKEMQNMKASAMELEKAHGSQMTEALENLRTLADAHQIKLASVQEAAQLKCEGHNSTFLAIMIIFYTQ